MRLLFLIHSLNIGGIETYVLRFAKWLHSNYPDIEMHIICKSGLFGPYEEEYRKEGVFLHPIKLGYFNLIRYLRFYKFLRLLKIDAICDFSGDFGGLPALCSFAARIPKRLIFYRNSRDSFKQSFTKKIYIRFMNLLVRSFGTKILSNSWEALRFYFPDYKNYKAPRFYVIPNGIPIPKVISGEEKIALRASIGVPDDQPIILHVGNCRRQKNHKLILSVAIKCKENKDIASFVLIGSGVRAAYENIVQELGLHNVKLLDIRRDVYSIMQISDVFIFPSFFEGQPNALLEAIISGLPFIASDINSIRELLPISWGKRWLFDPNNADEAYELLKLHLSYDFRKDKDFLNLVELFRARHDENNCFEKFFSLINE
jgi:glycosyltransferase involved in cell wall biosynthesis